MMKIKGDEAYYYRHNKQGFLEEIISSFETQLSADPLFQQLLSLENALTKVKNEISQNPQDHPDFKMDQNAIMTDLRFRIVFQLKTIKILKVFAFVFPMPSIRSKIKFSEIE